jgi:hypothetical protein
MQFETLKPKIQEILNQKTATREEKLLEICSFLKEAVSSL